MKSSQENFKLSSDRFGFPVLYPVPKATFLTVAVLLEKIAKFWEGYDSQRIGEAMAETEKGYNMLDREGRSFPDI